VSRSLARAALASLALIAGCGSDREPPPPAASARLAAGEIARVAGRVVRSETVAGIAAAQRIDATQARDAAVRDALFAAAAADGRLHEAPDVAFAASAVLARAVLHDIQRESEARGDVTDDELAQATARHWLELDRPEGVHVVHSVVRYAESDDASKKKRAGDVADAIRRAVLAARPDPQAPPIVTDAGTADALAAAFLKVAGEVPADGIEVISEDLPPMAADGRVLTPAGGTMDEVFAKAAAGLASRGDVSQPVVSPFGAHVILLLERIPERRVPADERRRALREEVLIGRQRAAEKALLEKLRAPVQIDPAADSLLQSVPIDR
jgi:peptidyl-prolyl cis-trans isomerase C